jgi:hypothetical protein
VAGDAPERISSVRTTDVRLLRGGEYGGGAGTVTSEELDDQQQHRVDSRLSRWDDSSR